MSGRGEGGEGGRRRGEGGVRRGRFPLRSNLNPEGFEARRNQLLLAKAENECMRRKRRGEERREKSDRSTDNNSDCDSDS